MSTDDQQTTEQRDKQRADSNHDRCDFREGSAKQAGGVSKPLTGGLQVSTLGSNPRPVNPTSKQQAEVRWICEKAKRMRRPYLSDDAPLTVTFDEIVCALEAILQERDAWVKHLEHKAKWDANHRNRVLIRGLIQDRLATLKEPTDG